MFFVTPFHLCTYASFLSVIPNVSYVLVFFSTGFCWASVWSKTYQYDQYRAHCEVARCFETKEILKWFANDDKDDNNFEN